MKCYYCTNPATGDHKIIIFGNYAKGTRDEKVDLCKPCYDKELARYRNEKIRTGRYGDDSVRDKQRDFRNGTGL